MKRTKSLINKIATKTLNIENCPIVNFIRTEKIEFLSDDALNIVKDNMNNVLNDIATLIKPRYISVIGYWKVRGGIITTITTKNIKRGWKDKNNILV